MATPLTKGKEDWKALAWANGTSRRASGLAGEKAARSWRPIVPPLSSGMKVKAIGPQVGATRCFVLPAAEEARKEMNGVVGMTSWAQLKSP